MPDEKDEIKSKAESKVKAKAKVKPKAKAEVRAKAKTKTIAKAETKAKANTETKIKAEASSLTFQIKRSNFTVFVALLAFIAGVGVGYLQWGLGGDQVAPLAPTQPGPSGDANGSSTNDQTEEELSFEEQIDAIERFEIDTDAHDPSFGPADASITIIEFSDFECPFCLRYFEQTFPQIKENYEGQIRYIFKDLPLVSIHPNAEPAAASAQCAFEQDAFWEYHDLLFSGGLDLSRSSYEAYAGQLDLDMEEFGLCLDEDRYSDFVQADLEYAIEIGARSTPTFFINGIAIVGAQPYELFAQIIDHELSKAVD